jgi:hypothetical protein
VKLPNSLLSLSFKLELAEPSYRSAASHGLWGAARSVLQCIILSLSLSRSLSLSLCTVTYCFSSPPIERECVCAETRESQVHGQGLFFGCLVVFCNSVAPHGVTCSSASPSPIPGLLFSPLSLFCSYTTTVSSCCLLVCIDCLADLNLHPFPKEINISSIQLFFY